jgi:hypothetical protein
MYLRGSKATEGLVLGNIYFVRWLMVFRTGHAA